MEENTYTPKKKPRTFPVPKELGTYLVKLRDKNSEDLNDGKFYYNAYATIYGREPFLKVKSWDFVRHVTDFQNFPHYVEWGPMVYSESEIVNLRPEQAASSPNYNSDGYNHDKLLNRYE